MKTRAEWPPAVFIIDGDSSSKTIILSGRNRWALERLMAAGARGCTPIDEPAPRWSGYILNLRQIGVAIETIHERHGGPFAGTHARYVLRSQVRRADAEQEAAA